MSSYFNLALLKKDSPLLEDNKMTDVSNKDYDDLIYLFSRSRCCGIYSLWRDHFGFADKYRRVPKDFETGYTDIKKSIETEILKKEKEIDKTTHNVTPTTKKLTSFIRRHKDLTDDEKTLLNTIKDKLDEVESYDYSEYIDDLKEEINNYKDALTDLEVIYSLIDNFKYSDNKNYVLCWNID